MNVTVIDCVQLTILIKYVVDYGNPGDPGIRFN